MKLKQRKAERREEEEWGTRRNGGEGRNEVIKSKKMFKEILE